MKRLKKAIQLSEVSFVLFTIKQIYILQPRQRLPLAQETYVTLKKQFSYIVRLVVKCNLLWIDEYVMIDRAVFTWLSNWDWFWFWFWFYYVLWLASVFTLVLVLRQSSENRSINLFQLLPPQSPRGFSALARLYYLATKTAMLRRLTKNKQRSHVFLFVFLVFLSGTFYCWAWLCYAMVF